MDYKVANQATKALNQDYASKISDAYIEAMYSVRDKIKVIYDKYGLNYMTGTGSTGYLSVMSEKDGKEASRLQRLLNDISTDLHDLNNSQPSLPKHLTEIFTKNFDDGKNMLKSATGVSIDLLDRDVIYHSAVSDLGKVALKKNQRAVVTNVRNGITQSIVQGETYEKMTLRVKDVLEQNANNAMRIARTETNRVANGAREIVMEKAHDLGINIKKKWISAKDDRTRESHAMLNDEVREINEAFSNGLQRPGDPNGSAAEVINCRCTMISVLPDYDETSPAPVAKPKTKSDPTLPVVPQVANKSSTQLDVDNFPNAFRDKTTLKQTKAFTNYINTVDGADEDMLKIYNNLGKLDDIESRGLPLKVAYTKKGHSVQVSSSRGFVTDVKVSIPKLDSENITGGAQTTAHELGHLIDLYGRKDTMMVTGWASSSDELKDAISKSRNGISEKVLNLFKSKNDEIRDITESARKLYDTDYKVLYDQFKELQKAGNVTYDDARSFKKAISKLGNEFMESREIAVRNAMAGVNGLEDIYDALSEGKYVSNGTVAFGHGTAYYRKAGAQAREIWANYASLSITRPDLIAMLAEDKPELVNALKAIKKKILGRIV